MGIASQLEVTRAEYRQAAHRRGGAPHPPDSGSPSPRSPRRRRCHPGRPPERREIRRRDRAAGRRSRRSARCVTSRRRESGCRGRWPTLASAILGSLVASGARSGGTADRSRSRIAENSRSASSSRPAARVKRRSRSGASLLGDGALVADVVLELRPRVLQDCPHLDGRGLLLALDGDEQVPARITPAALARRLQTHVAVVEQPHLVGRADWPPRRRRRADT